MEATNNVRTMEFIEKDFWDRPVYKCIETGSLWKDLTLGKGDKPDLFSCGNELDGEPDSPISRELTVVFKTKYEESPHRHNYMMLNRMQMQCEYFLGWGNRHEGHLCGESVAYHIEEMKKLHNSFPADQKPEWLTYAKLLEYERQMTTFTHTIKVTFTDGTEVTTQINGTDDEISAHYGQNNRAAWASNEPQAKRIEYIESQYLLRCSSKVYLFMDDDNSGLLQ